MNRPQIKTELPGPKAKEIIQRDAKVMSTSLSRDVPLVVERTQDVLRRFPDRAAHFGGMRHSQDHCAPDRGAHARPYHGRSPVPRACTTAP